MNRFLAIVGSLAGAVIFSVAIILARWQNDVHLSIGQAIVFGVIAACGFALMIAGYGGQRRMGTIVLDAIVILFLVGFVSPNLRTGLARSPQKRTMADLRSIATAVEARATDFNAYPAAQTLDDLARQLEPTYIKKIPRHDGYGNPFRYEAWKEDPKSPGPDHYAIGSAGHDWKFDKSSLRQYSSGPFTNFDCDLVYTNGTFVTYPEGVQTEQASREPKTLFDEATAVYRQGEYSRAIPMFEEFLRKNPDHALANARLGMSYCAVSRYEEAVPILKKAIALDATDYQSPSNLALAYEKLGKPEQGIEWARKAVALQPNDAGVINNLGWVLLQAHHNSEAVSVFERAVRLAPGVAQYRENLERARASARRRS
jgi:tetratricopeptide (TPR) repeat protein